MLNWSREFWLPSRKLFFIWERTRESTYLALKISMLSWDQNPNGGPCDIYLATKFHGIQKQGRNILRRSCNPGLRSENFERARINLARYKTTVIENTVVEWMSLRIGCMWREGEGRSQSRNLKEKALWKDCLHMQVTAIFQEYWHLKLIIW